MGIKINNFKDLLSYCEKTNTYTVKKINDLVYLSNGEILIFKDSKNYV